MKITLTTIVKNEQSHLASCLLSVKEYVNEMIVVDTGSTDNTKQIAIDCGATVYDFPWTNSFAEARNYALQQATGDWILVLDADEQLVPETAHAIRKFADGSPAIGRVNIISKYLDNGEIHYAKSPISRFFPKGVYYKGNIHEQVVSDLPHRMTEISILHDGYYQTDKTERNLKLLNRELEQDKNNPYLLMQIAREHKNKQDYVTADFYFSQSYKLTTKREGYFPKLVVEFIYNLMKLSKLDECYNIIQQEQPTLEEYPDFHFASGMFYMDYILSNVAAHVEKLPRIEKSFLRCLQLGERAELSGTVGTGSFLAAYNLGVYLEVVGDIQKARHFYELSSGEGYEKATNRLRILTAGM
ncbi:glycosyltransferase family 2 protein [Brevibacillus centrosporus]|uniref:glycosyltransferase family 2 protein n=1 Tax=Brevibacillus centrosporus TaxID=54910 RepID=UPI002E1A3AF0|nr:glycosyltransferase family 2 protein [Brevibacillus centrosporus]